MINERDYLSHDMTGLVEWIRRREVSASEVLDAAIAREAAVNPGINAIAQHLHDHGREAIAAGLPEGPLSGAPYLLKDVSAQLKGTPTRSGARMTSDAPATEDSEIIMRLKAAGAVIFGKTTTPEMGLAASTETTLTGDTRNPWNLAHSSGGSSGGAAAAVAGGIVPAAHASDGGGSIRIPASCCGLFGLKPSRGRVSFAPFAGEGWGGLAAQHAVTRTVRDSALLLDVTSGAGLGDPYHAIPHSASFRGALEVPPGKLRLALVTRPYRGGKIDKVCADAVTETARLLESMGHEVEEVAPDLDWEEYAHAIWVLVATTVAVSVQNLFESKGSKPKRRDMERVTWGALEFAKTLRAEDYSRALASTHNLGRKIAEFHQTYDMILSPTLAAPALKIGRQHTNETPQDIYEKSLMKMTAFTQLSNMSGAPAMSVPLHRTKSGLPVGVMFSAAMGHEAQLFSLAAELERAQPWPQLAVQANG
jgi:Asp-tRNA(Asn)/Glu-tRNA(Gln) amidotransferase A subunit family amidase